VANRTHPHLHTPTQSMGSTGQGQRTRPLPDPAPGCEGTADHADHILAVTEGGAEYDVSNGQGACTHCHNIKTREEIQRGRARSYGRAKHPTETHPGMMTP
jgi:5-methylcytosine-specific restriction endonuclease McrA